MGKSVLTLWLGSMILGLAVGAGLPRVASGQDRIVPQGAAVELVADGFRFTEGPVWFEGALLFSDIPANTVYRWTPDGGTNVYLKPSGHANGLAVDVGGRLLLAQHDRQVGRRSAGGEVVPLVRTYGGRRLNSPNDLTVAADGTIYFTDPPYGVKKNERRLSFSGVYRLSPDGDVTLLTKQFDRPNGIVLSPDDSTLYVSDSRRTEVWAFEVTSGGDIRNGQAFAAPSDSRVEGTTDGLTVDAAGRVYTTGPGGIWIYSPDGERRARIAVPKAPTNVAFGGSDGRTLFITARAHVYRIGLNAKGVQ